MVHALSCFVSCLALGGSDFRGDEPSVDSTERQFRAIVDESAEARRAFGVRYEAASEEERKGLVAKTPGPEDDYGRLLAPAGANPEDPAEDLIQAREAEVRAAKP